MSKDSLGGHWGMSISVDMDGCDLDKISNPSVIKEFVAQLIEKVGMKAHGPCYIDRFGQGILEGYSAMQFIETSSITVHCDEPGERCFVDIFSCKKFDAGIAEEFCVKAFNAKKVKSRTLLR